jgi:hypothetical protein
MKKIYRTCEVTKEGLIFASCQLQCLNEEYVVIDTENSDDLFIDFDLEISKNELPDVAIKYFEFECLNRFTCYRKFTIVEIKENSGEEISFY